MDVVPMSSLAGKKRHKRVPSSASRSDVATFGKVEETTQAVEQDPTGRVSLHGHIELMPVTSAQEGLVCSTCDIRYF